MAPSRPADDNATTLRAAGDAAEPVLQLVVIEGSRVTTLDIAPGRVAIGRGSSCAVRLEDPLVSRVHAWLHVGSSLEVELEDNGSANGTRLRDAALTPHQRVEVVPGEAIGIGTALLMLRAAAPHPLRPPEGEDRRAKTTMQRLEWLAARAASSSINVLIVGETGVGKDVMARRVHALSPRRDKNLVSLNAAALTDALLESELFGYEKGAFTGATHSKPGLLESAPGGTIFLDEVGEMPLTTQAKLLRVLETREVTRVGGLSPRRIDVRFIAATNRELHEAVARGTFRQDLYYRLNGMTLHVPPLRERVDEIPALAEQFARKMAEEVGRPAPSISAPVLRLFAEHTWPGNIRELRSVVERAVLIAEGETIELDDVQLDLPPAQALGGVAPGVSAASPPALGAGAAGSEKERILAALEACAGNQSRAAKMLGMRRGTFIARLESFGVARPRKNSGGSSE